MIKSKLTKKEYYAQKMSMFMSQSYGITEQANLIIELLNNIDDTIDGFFNVLDIFNDNYSKWLESHSNDDFKPLDTLAKIVGVDRKLKLTVKKTYLKIPEKDKTYDEYYKLTPQQHKENESVHVERLFEISNGFKFKTEPSHEENYFNLLCADSNNKNVYYNDGTNVSNVGQPDNFPTHSFLCAQNKSTTIFSVSEATEYANIEEGLFIKYLMQNFNSNSNENNNNNITQIYWGTTSPYDETNKLVETDDLKYIPYKIYFSISKVSSNYTGFKVVKEVVDEEEILTLSNEELVKVIKMKIVRNRFDGTKKTLIKLYKDIQMPIYIYQSDSSAKACSIYLDISDSDKYELTPNIIKIFRFSDFLISSLGMSYSKIPTSQIDGLFILNVHHLSYYNGEVLERSDDVVLG